MASSPVFCRSDQNPAYPDLRTCKIIAAISLWARACCFSGLPATTQETERWLGFKQIAPILLRQQPSLEDSHSLNDHLNAFVAALEQHLSATGAEAAHGVGTQVVEELARNTQDAQVHAGSSAHSIDQLFLIALESTGAAYARLAPGTPRIDVMVNLQTFGNPGLNEVVAKTRFGAGDRKCAREADVTVEVSAEAFNEDDYFGLLPRLHHELFVHAVQAVDRPGRRESYGSCCPLAEGFVDNASHRVLLASIAEMALPDELDRVRVRLSTETTREHVVRMAFPDADAPLSAKQAHIHRVFGRDLFDRLLALRGRGEHALEWVNSLAARLNLCDMSRHQRKQLLERVHEGLNGTMKVRIVTMGVLEEIRFTGDPTPLLGDWPIYNAHAS